MQRLAAPAELATSTRVGRVDVEVCWVEHRVKFRMEKEASGILGHTPPTRPYSRGAPPPAVPCPWRRLRSCASKRLLGSTCVSSEVISPSLHQNHTAGSSALRKQHKYEGRQRGGALTAKSNR